MGPGDHHVHAGQADICLRKPRKGDNIIVTEKLDGANVAVANLNGDVIPLIRSGYRARDAKFEHLRFFDLWVYQNYDRFAFLRPGERVCGEWLALAHGTQYDPSNPFFSPFIAFDLFDPENKRVTYKELIDRVWGKLELPAVLHNDSSPFTVEEALELLQRDGHGFHGATEPVEGAVWRVEHKGKVDFLCKYVRPDKVDGKYLPELNDNPPIWHWRP